MENVIQKGFAEKVKLGASSSSDTEKRNVWYIPHQGVYHPKKPTKIHIVFDCAAEGESLNKHLLQGPDLTNTLTGVLKRFRQEHVGLICDVECMSLNCSGIYCASFGGSMETFRRTQLSTKWLCTFSVQPRLLVAPILLWRRLGKIASANWDQLPLISCGTTFFTIQTITVWRKLVLKCRLPHFELRRPPLHWSSITENIICKVEFTLSSFSVKVGFMDITIKILEKSHSHFFEASLSMRRPQGLTGTIVQFVHFPFSSRGNIIQKKTKKKTLRILWLVPSAYGLGTSNK